MRNGPEECFFVTDKHELMCFTKKKTNPNQNNNKKNKPEEAFGGIKWIKEGCIPQTSFSCTTTEALKIVLT